MKLAVSNKPSKEIRKQIAVDAHKADLDRLYNRAQELKAKLDAEPPVAIDLFTVSVHIMDTTFEDFL
jgi:hypothetical protein